MYHLHEDRAIVHIEHDASRLVCAECHLTDRVGHPLMVMLFPSDDPHETISHDRMHVNATTGVLQQIVVQAPAKQLTVLHTGDCYHEFMMSKRMKLTRLVFPAARHHSLFDNKKPKEQDVIKRRLHGELLDLLNQWLYSQPEISANVTSYVTTRETTTPDGHSLHVVPSFRVAFTVEGCPLVVLPQPRFRSLALEHVKALLTKTGCDHWTIEAKTTVNAALLELHRQMNGGANAGALDVKSQVQCWVQVVQGSDLYRGSVYVSWKVCPTDQDIQEFVALLEREQVKWSDLVTTKNAIYNRKQMIVSQHYGTARMVFESMLQRVTTSGTLNLTGMRTEEFVSTLWIEAGPHSEEPWVIWSQNQQAMNQSQTYVFSPSTTATGTSADPVLVHGYSHESIQVLFADEHQLNNELAEVPQLQRLQTTNILGQHRMFIDHKGGSVSSKTDEWLYR